jgi:hypothetical protein
VPLSKPMRMVTFKFTDEEKAALERLAAERNVTMTWAVKEGIRLQLEDLAAKRRDREPPVIA